MNILSVASEAVPFAKTGGLADVAGALPGALARLGHRMVTVMPLHRKVDKARHGLKSTGRIVGGRVGGHTHIGAIWMTEQGGAETYFIEHNLFFDRDGLYGEGGDSYGDNAARFAFFSQAALDLCGAIGFAPDVIHCHDWQTALVPVYLRERPGAYPDAERAGTVLTIHNLAYQGVFGFRDWPALELPDHTFSIDGLEYHGTINLLKGGMKYAHAITTVSRTYAREIQTPAFGYGLDGVARFRAADLHGIVNGVDTALWDPAHDPALSQPFSADAIDGREANRELLRHSFGLADGAGPIIGMVGRLAEQKGLNLLLDALDGLMRRDVRLVILGEGDPAIMRALERAAAHHGGRLRLHAGFDEGAARRIYGGCDLFLMPSAFEPCGLAQLIAMRYGALPVVHRVGGLADTVIPYGSEPLHATGFAFDRFTPEALLACLDTALEVFRHGDVFRRLQRNAMGRDVSWAASAKGYVDVYRTVAQRAGAVPSGVARG